MKKKFFVFAAAAMMTTGVFAQVSFGVKAGLNLSKYTVEFGDESETSDNRISAAFGGFMNYQLSDKFSIQPELLISMEGGKEESSVEGFDIKSTSKITFLNIPVMAKANIANGLYLEAGPQLGFKLSAKNEMEAAGQSKEEDIEDMKSMNFALGIGAGYEMENGLGIGLRYNLGLSNLYDGEGDGTYKINTINIGVSYKF
ncbi:outer membrane protein with beta-barrel domain [Breznakibacter xylanolyticus]|uniref:Outer membrane protein with beta-barrel domain n=1 Tax=Breznakibacter xylanolyticus TaxID=990 RepID=A0A2W7NKI8_9BACT|nr:porin family protein [Breznakibacter xylanolyticus]PZX18607.1 outer membrane protein with beta-barrel domain [Breznakibacter xylanolyticus]